MDWSNERYVRLYTKDTGDWLMWPWQTRALFVFILRKADRAGIIHFGKGGMPALAAMVGMPSHDVTQWIAPLVEDGCVRLNGEYLCVPNYIAAQETPQSDRARQRQSRERIRDRFVAATGREPTAIEIETERQQPSRAVTSAVTPCHAPSRDVTPSLAVPSLAVPSDTAPQDAADQTQVSRKVRGHRLPDDWEPTTVESAHSWHQIARSRALTVGQVSEAKARFKDHWRAAAGQRGVKLDWEATWRNWLRGTNAAPAYRPRANDLQQQPALPGEHDWSVAARAKAKVV